MTGAVDGWFSTHFQPAMPILASSLLPSSDRINEPGCLSGSYVRWLFPVCLEESQTASWGRFSVIFRQI